MPPFERSDPGFSACGLNCGLCPRHHTQGASRCPGCGGQGFSLVHPACGVLSCCARRGLEYCYLCGEFPCKRYDGADKSDSFITHTNQMADLARTKAMGLGAYMEEQEKKRAILEALLGGYDDGRRKSFFCLAVNLLPLAELESILQGLLALSDARSLKEKAAFAENALQTAADARGISLRLRKK